MNFFPNSNEEISLIKFISQYQYLNINDEKYFFGSNKYYKERISSLIKKQFLRRVKRSLVLDSLGIEYAKLHKFEYHKVNRNKKYKKRLLRVSNIGAFYLNCDTVQFTPSYSIKDKEAFTTTSRKYIGIITINGIEYLIYQITEENDQRYIKSVLLDIEKDSKYKNIIVLTYDIKKINLQSFCFGLYQVLIVEDTEENREKLKYLNSVNWNSIIQRYYKNAYLSEYSFCDYADNRNKYISTFYFLDTEKINRIKHFLRESDDKEAELICSPELKSRLQKELPNANVIAIDLDEYIVKKRNYYE